MANCFRQRLTASRLLGLFHSTLPATLWKHKSKVKLQTSKWKAVSVCKTRLPYPSPETKLKANGPNSGRATIVLQLAHIDNVRSPEADINHTVVAGICSKPLSKKCPALLRCRA